MYNLYIYEKQILKDEKEKNELIKKKKLKKKRKKELVKLTKNYDNRMNDFILTMCQNPIYLYKEENPYNKNKKYIKKNYFEFGTFKTDKERLECLEKEKEILKKYEKKREHDQKKRNISTIKNHRNLTLIQPKMRFNSRTKLENIIEIIKQKGKNTNIDIYNNVLMEQMKKLKYNDVKKIKEYNILIEKKILDKKELKETIKMLNEKEQNEINNEYSLKNYIDWKYLGTISYPNKLHKSRSQKNMNINKLEDVIEIIGNKSNIDDETINEFECLVKDDFKTHFKGASQYIFLKDLKEPKDKVRNNAFSLITNDLINPANNFYKKRAISALKLTTNNKTIETLLNNKKGNKNNGEQITKIYHKPKMKKRPASVIVNKFNDNNNEYKYFKNDYSIKDLSEEFKLKKIKMKDMMNKEINNSIIKQYSNKYSFLSDINNTGLINPKTLVFQNNSKKGNEKELKQKLTYLQEEIARQKRLRNKDKYEQFVKRFARSTYGFRKKEILNKLGDFQEDKKSDYVIIDGKVFQKNDIKNITDLIFTKCNYYNQKSDSNNGVLIKNNGKLMFTSGLNIGDFSSKYNL